MRRSVRFCLALPRCAIGAFWFAVAMKVAKFVMSSATLDTSIRSEPHHLRRDRLRRRLQHRRGDRVHRVPEPPVVQRRGRDLREPVRRGGLPPVGERLPSSTARPAGSAPPAPGRSPRTAAARPAAAPAAASIVATTPRSSHHAPGRGDVAERQVPGPLGQHRRLPGVQQRLDLGRGPQVALGDHLRLAVHPRHLPQVPVRAPPNFFGYRLAMTIGHTPGTEHNQVPDERVTRGNAGRMSAARPARTLNLGNSG